MYVVSHEWVNKKHMAMGHREFSPEPSMKASHGHVFLRHIEKLKGNVGLSRSRGAWSVGRRGPNF